MIATTDQDTRQSRLLTGKEVVVQLPSHLLRLQRLSLNASPARMSFLPTSYFRVTLNSERTN